MKPVAHVVGVGATSSLGLSAMATALCHRAGSGGMREAPFVDAAGEPITMCYLPTLPNDAPIEDRLVALASRALRDLAAHLPTFSRPPRVELVLCLDDDVAGGGSPKPTFDMLVRHLGGVLPWESARAVARGAAGAAWALDDVVARLESGAIDFVVVGGVHSDHDERRVRKLVAERRLFHPEQLDALMPGESAAFVALASTSSARRNGLPLLASIVSHATGQERARHDNDESAFAATGMSAAVRSALAPLASATLRCGWVLTDVGFETYRHYELSAIVTRNARVLGEPYHVESPAQRLGFLGAAALPMHLVLAAEAYRRGYAPHRYCLALAGSETGERAAIVLSAPDS